MLVWGVGGMSSRKMIYEENIIVKIFPENVSIPTKLSLSWYENIVNSFMLERGRSRQHQPIQLVHSGPLYIEMESHS